MSDEDPLSLVQVRYAKGDIDTAEYEEFLSWFLKNISFQQVPSLKIASERYANGEINIGQYKEILSHLLNDIVNYQQSAPLRIIHLRYAEGEIDTNEFEERMKVLMKDIPAYPQSPPLSVLFTRYAKGEIDNLRYQEMLTHLATYCTPNLPTDAGKEAPQTEKPQVSAKQGASASGQKNQVTGTSGSPSKPPEIPPSPDPYRLNFAAIQNPASGGVIQPSASPLDGALHQDMHPGGSDIHALGHSTGMVTEPSVVIKAAGEITAESGSYLITDTSPSSAPVTVLVKPEIEKSRKEENLSFKQNIVNAAPKGFVPEARQSNEVKNEPGLETVSEIQDGGKVIPKVSSSPSGDHSQVKSLIKQGKYQEAITKLDEMLLSSPDDYRSLFLKSISLFNLGKGDEALLILNKAKETCTNKDDTKEIERIYNHIVQKGNGKSGQRKDKPQEKDITRKPSLSTHPELSQFENAKAIEKICESAQGFIDAGDYKAANEILADISDLVKDIPADLLQKESIDDIFAAKGFVLYQLKEFCEAKKYFKEATKINPKNETAIHYLNDIRVRDCNKFVRHI